MIAMAVTVRSVACWESIRIFWASYAVIPINNASARTAKERSNAALLTKIFTIESKITPISPMIPIVPMVERSLFVTVPAMARPRNIAAAMKNTTNMLDKENMANT